MSGFLGRVLSRLFIFVGIAFLCTIGLAATLMLLIVAIYFAFALFLSPPLAALAAAFCTLALTAIVVLIGNGLLRSVGRAPKRRERERPSGSLLGDVLGPELIDLIDRHPSKMIAAALAVGLVIGFSPAARAFLRDFLRR